MGPGAPRIRGGEGPVPCQRGGSGIRQARDRRRRWRNDYFSVRELEAEYDLITNTITTYQRSLELTQNRRRGGIVTDLDVAQAETQLRTAEAQSPDIPVAPRPGAARPGESCGESPVALPIATNSTEDVVEPEVPASLPANCWNNARIFPRRSCRWPPRTPRSRWRRRRFFPR